MNILLTCIGRRNYLIGYFKQALGTSGHVFGADASLDAPGMQEVDQAFVVPPVNDAAYCDTLLALCVANDVKLVVSLNDLELPLLAKAREKFAAADIQVAVSQPDIIELCFDKYATHRFLIANKCQSPLTFVRMPDALAAIESDLLRFPCMIKPRWGTASIGIDKVYDVDELRVAYGLAHKRLMRTFLASASSKDPEHAILIQQCLSGDEYGLDIVNDFSGRHAATFIKLKLSMRAGETDRAITVADQELETLGSAIGRSLGHIGNLDCDVFRTQAGLFVLELNPRFGGGYPFSQEAGANVPAAFVAWAQGKSPNPESLRVKPGVCCAKCDRMVHVLSLKSRPNPNSASSRV